MKKKIKQYTITHKDYRLTVLNIGATIIEYSLNDHNICLRYEKIDDYRKNELCMGSIIGRSSGRIKEAKLDNWDIPKNYLGKHNIHGNNLHHSFYTVIVEPQKIILTLFDPEGEFPGNANIKVIYRLTDNGLVQEISAISDRPTLFNFTNHSYFRLGGKVLNDYLQVESDVYTDLDDDMFAIEDKSVDETCFDFRKPKKIGDCNSTFDCKQFSVTKGLNHPYRLNGKIKFYNKIYRLEITSTSNYVVIYSGNFIGASDANIKDCKKEDYAGICFETQERPGFTGESLEYFSKTIYELHYNKS